MEIKHLYLNEECKPDSRFPNRYTQFRLTTIPKGGVVVQEKSKHIKVSFILEGQLIVSWSYQGEQDQSTASGGDIVFSPMYVEGTAYAVEETRIISFLCTTPHPIYYSRAFAYLNNNRGDLDINSSYLYTLPITQNLRTYLNLLEEFINRSNIPNTYTGYDLHEVLEGQLCHLFVMEYSSKDLFLFFSRGLSRNILFTSLVLCSYKSCRTVKELAQKCGYEINRFTHLFKQNFDCAPYQWLRNLTNRHLFEDLQKGDCSMKEIMNKYNFGSPSHFTAYCKRNFGEPPTHIRRSLRLSKEKTE